MRSRQRSEDGFGEKFAGFLFGFNASIDAVPFDGNAGGIYRADRGIGDFGTDPVAGNQSDGVGHLFIIDANRDRV